MHSTFPISSLAASTSSRSSRIPPAAKEVLDGDVWFSLLPSDLKAGMLDIGRVKTLKADELLCYRGQPASGLYALVRGGALVFKETHPGHESLLARWGACAWFGEAGLFDGMCHTHNIKADIDSVFVHFPMTLLWRMLEAAPQYWKWMGVLSSQRLRMCYAAFDELGSESLETRVVRRIGFMALGMGLTGQPSIVRVHHQQLAEMLGVSRASIAIVLKALKGRGVIELAYGKIKILDMEALKQLSFADYALPLATSVTDPEGTWRP